MYCETNAQRSEDHHLSNTGTGIRRLEDQEAIVQAMTDDTASAEGWPKRVPCVGSGSSKLSVSIPLSLCLSVSLSLCLSLSHT